MGWLFNQAESEQAYKEALIREHKTKETCWNIEGQKTGRTSQAIMSEIVGENVWSLFVFEEEGKVVGADLVCYLIDSYHENGSLWVGYKNISVTMHPYNYDAPKHMVEKYLEIRKDEPGQYEKDWFSEYNKQAVYS
jgi:hypothetical protein